MAWSARLLRGRPRACGADARRGWDGGCRSATASFMIRNGSNTKQGGAMLDNATALTIIERAEAETPLCWCNAPTAAVVHDGSIWLRCRSLDHSTTPVRRLV